MMNRKAQASLFDETDRPRLPSLLDGLPAKPADKAQAKFQRLIEQIEQQRALLKAWRDYFPRYQQRVDTEIRPLESESNALQRAIAFAIDKALDTRGHLPGKAQQRLAEQSIIDICRDLLDAGDDPEIEALHDRYSDRSFKEDQAVEQSLQNSLLASIFGGSPEDYADDDSGEIFLNKLRKRNAAEGEDGEPSPQTSRQKGRNAQAAKAEAEASQSLRDVFRKLASALHPDRESDPAERERKTALMQRVNQAYAAKDLLGLLNLQFEIEQIDTAHIAQLSAARLKQYIAILNEQLIELKAEISHVTAPFREIMRYYKPNFLPDQVDKSITAEIVGLKQYIRELKQQLADCADKQKLKAMLRELSKPGWSL